MLSNQILQNTIDGLKNITKREFCIVERSGSLVVTTNPDIYQEIKNDLTTFIASQAESQLIKGYQHFKAFDTGKCEYVIIIDGDDEESYKIGKITTFQVQNLLVAYKARYDKDNFIKNLLLDNLLLMDIHSRAQRLNISAEARRVVYLIENAPKNGNSVLEIMKNLFSDKMKDFISVVDENTVVLVKEVDNNATDEDIMNIAKTISDSVQMEIMDKVRVSIGVSVFDIKNVPTSFKEARLAMEVGKIFNESDTVANYKNLGIGRLIYQLPESLCRMFLEEILKDVTLDRLDEDILDTADKFFENSLNVSETSRKLFVHRNTLVYRLDKLEKIIGIDLRNFEDAIIFKIALMVGKYLDYKEKQKER